jgi:hypothetical protein
MWLMAIIGIYKVEISIIYVRFPIRGVFPSLEIENIMCCLNHFSCGQKVSSAKTKMLFPENVSDDLAHSISHICGFWEDWRPCKIYWGISSSSRMH